MDKIDFSLASLLNHPDALKQGAKKTKGAGETKGSRKTFFSDILSQSIADTEELGPIREYAASEEALTLLMDAVHSAGSDLLERPFQDEILKYKKAVRNFIHYVVENTYKVSETQVRRRLDTKVYVQIQVIDNKLEELAAAILSGQATQLEKVSKLDEIKGLLVDLTITGAIGESNGSRGQLRKNAKR